MKREVRRLWCLLFGLLLIGGNTACSTREKPEADLPGASIEIQNEQEQRSNLPQSQTANSSGSQEHQDAEVVLSKAAKPVESKPAEPKVADTSGEQPIAPETYQKRLGKGMDVDWSKTKQGRKYYNAQAAKDFADAGVSHVRIRISDEASPELLAGLDQQISDCLSNGIIPIIAYQADAFKNDPSEENIQTVMEWWTAIAQRYRNASHLLSFDLLIEATDSLNQQPEKLNEIYERLVAEIRKTNPTRIILISPRLRSDAAYLKELKIPTAHNGYLMAEWHFYASGPSKTNERKLWTTGTLAEQALINEKIALALEWQKQTGLKTWVGAWMPGNYNDGNDYTVAEQVQFADYMTKQLIAAGIPFAVNSDTKFYDRENNGWIAEMRPVFQCIFG